MKNSLREQYRINIKILVVLIISLFMLFSASNKLSQDYTNYKNLHYELNNEIIPHEQNYDNYLINLYYNTDFEYKIYLIFLTSATVILFYETRTLYKKLREVKK